jgi:hypothetical protein
MGGSDGPAKAGQSIGVSFHMQARESQEIPVGRAIHRNAVQWRSETDLDR